MSKIRKWPRLGSREQEHFNITPTVQDDEVVYELFWITIDIRKRAVDGQTYYFF